jgi:hypothetical protein
VAPSGQIQRSARLYLSISSIAKGLIFIVCWKRLTPRLNANPVAIQIPGWAWGLSHVKDPFRGVIDLIEMQMLTFNQGDDRCEIVKQEPIPEELLDDAQGWRDRDARIALSGINEMMELAFEEKEIPVILDSTRLMREGVYCQQDSTCSMWFCIAWKWRSAGVGCGNILLAEPVGSSPCRGCESKEKGQGRETCSFAERSFLWFSVSRFFRPKRATSIGFAAIRER